MKKVGICFPQNDFLNMTFDEFKKYILMFKEKGLYSFDMYTSLIIGEHKNINELLLFLNEIDIKVTFHYDNIYNESLDEKTSNMICKQYSEDLVRLRNKLAACEILYKTTVVFHSIDYKKEFEHYEQTLYQGRIFNEICVVAATLDFDILVETLAYNHPYGNHIGDDYNEIDEMIKINKHDNFGVCWDIGHTRLNSLEEYSDVYLPVSIIEKVKFIHIHSFTNDDGIHVVIEHLPLINNLYEKSEIKYLLDNNYDGIFSIETNTDNLKENINIYLKSIDIMNNMLGGN